MKPSAQRRVERQIKKIMIDDGDRCSVCKASFQHNCKTFGGVTVGGVAALVSDCCKRKLAHVILAGVYADNNSDILTQMDRTGASGRLPPDQLEKAIGNIQAHVTKVDQLAATILKRGGIPDRKSRLSTTKNAWKEDDAAWFKANPKRAHRLRSMFVEEAGTMFSDAQIPPLPPGHEHQVLVRQIEPGMRVRISFGRNLDFPIPDSEAIIHALFDTVSASQGGVISPQTVAELSERYATSSKNST